MTTKILLKPTRETCFDYFVHEEHESDLCDFLKNHTGKQQIGYTEPHTGVEWFVITLTSEDVEAIKQTAWYINAKWNNENLDFELVEGAKLETFIAEYVPTEGVVSNEC